MDAVLLRRIILGISVSLALAFAMVVLLRQPQQAPVLEPELAAVPPVQAEEPVTVPQPPWRLAVWQGRVAVFEAGGQEPARVLDTPVSSLPQPDQSALEAGIDVWSQEELAGFLEDYGS